MLISLLVISCKYFSVFPPGRGQGIGYHDLFRTSSKARRYISDVVSDPLQDPFYDGCNTVKTCFGVPDDCVERQNCNVVTTVAVQGNKFLINMRAKSAAYVATGLSEDQQMVSILAISCRVLRVFVTVWEIALAYLMFAGR